MSIPTRFSLSTLAPSQNCRTCCRPEMAAPPQCSDWPVLAVLPFVPTVPAAPFPCQNFIPPHIYPACPGVPTRHPTTAPHTICDRCDVYTTLRLNADPGVLANLRVSMRGFSPAFPPLVAGAQCWQSANEQVTGILDPWRVYPINPGFLTRMCAECENIVQDQHARYSAGAMAVPMADALKWQQIPGPVPGGIGVGGPMNVWNSCTYLYTTDNNNLMPLIPAARPPRLCHVDRRAAWEAVLNQRNIADRWLRRAYKRDGAIVEANTRNRRRRVRNGTFRACPCGKDVVNPRQYPGVLPIQPPPRPLFCMGCGGYECLPGR